MEIKDLLKELDKDLVVENTELIDGVINVYCTLDIDQQVCPFCNEISKNVHTHYTRTIQDLPMQSHKVLLHVHTKKYFCYNKNCNHTTFAERLSFAEQRAVKTNRLIDYVNKVGLRNSSMDTTRDLKDSAIDISVDTVLRIIKKKAK